MTKKTRTIYYQETMEWCDMAEHWAISKTTELPKGGAWLTREQVEQIADLRGNWVSAEWQQDPSAVAYYKSQYHEVLDTIFNRWFK